MKSLIVTLVALAFSQSVFAATPSEVVRQIEATEGRTCYYQSISKMEYCLNYICQYKKYYACVNQENEATLVLKLRSIQIPGEAADITVLGYELY